MSESDSSSFQQESNGEGEVKLSTIPGFEAFTEYTLSPDGTIYRFGKPKLWQGGGNSYVQLCQKGMQVKIYKHVVDQFQDRQDVTETPDGFKKVSKIPGYEKFTKYYFKEDDLHVYRHNDVIKWLNGSIILSQAGHRKSLSKIALQEFIDSTELIWKPMSNPIEPTYRGNIVDMYKGERKKMRRYLKNFRISNRGHIRKRVNGEWVDVKFNGMSYICLPSEEDDQIEVDKDDLEDFLETFFDTSEINVDLSILD